MYVYIYDAVALLWWICMWPAAGEDATKDNVYIHVFIYIYNVTLLSWICMWPAAGEDATKEYVYICICIYVCIYVYVRVDPPHPLVVLYQPV